MSRVLKVFGTAEQRREAAAGGTKLADYDAFTVVELPDDDAKRVSRRHLVEDITNQYALPVDTRTAKAVASPKAAAVRRAARPKRPGPGRHHYIVQFAGPIKRAWLIQVKKAGGEPRVPYPGFSYIVRANARGRDAIEALPSVRAIMHLPHSERIASATKQRAAGGRKTAAVDAVVPRTHIRDGVYTVQFFGTDDLAKSIGKIKKLGFRVLDRPKNARLVIVESSKAPSAQPAQLDQLSAVHGVQQIRERSIKRTSNDVSAGLMGAVGSSGAALTLSGQGETICVCDTGIDTGDAATVHQDFAGRISAIRSFPITPDFAPYINNPGGDDGASDRDSGHGTHVTGSVLGDGAGSVGLPDLVGRVRGLAHRARLVFQAIEQELDWKNPLHEQRYGRFLLAGIPGDLTVLLQDAYTRGARIHSNSWGGGDPGAYDAQCEQLDRFVWNHKDMCVLVAAGNDGTDADGDGTINPMSVTSPGTAKNCITVGASENHRPAFDHETYGEWWPNDYPVAPFKNAAMADDPGQVVAFSSRGPTLDGRFKPEVVAPGTFVLSTRSTRIALNNTAWAAYPHNRLYFYMGGTSMATPLTAGAVALIRERLRNKNVAGGPTAALIKGMLIASTTRLAAAGPARLVDNDQGYGLVNLKTVLKPVGQRKVKVQNVQPGLATGQAWEKTVTVSGSAGLRVVMAYSDSPGAALVNNLNLIVHGPDGSRFVGNQAAAGSLSLDTANNVEIVHVPSAKAGQWRIEVIASNVPDGPQDFALVIVGRVS